MRATLPLRPWEQDQERVKRSGAYYAAQDLLRDGVFPSPTALMRALGRRGYGPINVRDNAGRRAALREAGWTQDKVGGRWYKP